MIFKYLKVCIYYLLCSDLISHAMGTETFQIPIFFPKERLKQAESYLCTSVFFQSFTSSNGSLYIEAFTPVADMSEVHHMLLYGCSEPGITTERLWDCGMMMNADGHGNDGLPVAGICSEGQARVLYAWARNAPRLVLPEDVTFQVGGNTSVQSLVLVLHTADHQSQKHQMNVDQEESHRKKMSLGHDLDDVGIIVHVSDTPSTKLAGVFLLGSGGAIPPQSTVHLEIACLLTENKVIHPFAFRTHSHSLGKVISGYRVRHADPPSKGRFVWTLIGKKDPQLPQMFYPVEEKDMVLKRGDILAVRCTMESNRSTTTHIGPTGADEMCNFYLMYSVNEGDILESTGCYNFGPIIEDFWTNGPLGLNNFPSDASRLL